MNDLQRWMEKNNVNVNPITEDNDPVVPNLHKESIVQSGQPHITTYDNNTEPVEIVEPTEIVQSTKIVNNAPIAQQIGALGLNDSEIKSHPEMVNCHYKRNAKREIIRPNAFTTVVMEQLKNNDGVHSMGHNIRVMQENGKLTEASIVGPNYLVIINKDLHEQCEAIRARTGLNWVHDKLFFDGKRYRNVYRTEDSGIALEKVGDTAHIMFTETNSYDGSSPAGFRIDFMVLSCLNGMVSPRYGMGTNFRHSLNSINWKEEIQRSALMLTGQRVQDKLYGFSQAIDRLYTPINMENLNVFRNKYIPKLNSLRYGEILTKFHKEEGVTAWDLCQAGTDTFWHRNKRNSVVKKADFDNNGYFVDGMLDYGRENLQIAQLN